jgi:hypothetical protein
LIPFPFLKSYFLDFCLIEFLNSGFIGIFSAWRLVFFLVRK